MNHSGPDKNYIIYSAAFEKSLLLRNFHRQIYKTLRIKHTQEKEFVVIVVCSSSTQSQVIHMTPGKIWIH